VAPERFTAQFNVGARPVTLDVTAGSVQNPLRLREFESFSCPGRQ
jgi:type VI secretion system protein ImpL